MGKEVTLFDSMAKHPDIAPVFDLLKLVDPVDEFSEALVLVRDCFSPDTTLRTLSRRELSSRLKARTALVRAYEVALMDAAKKFGYSGSDFMEAVNSLPPLTAQELRDSYQRQVSELMNRKL